MPTADELLSAHSVHQLTKCLRRAAPDLKWSSLKVSTRTFPELGLGERAVIVRDALLIDLPSSYALCAKIFRAALKNDSFTSWMLWPVGEAAALKALASSRDADFEDGLKLLAQLTGRFSSEFAIRTFLNDDLRRTLDTAVLWTASDDEAVRRLASEGTRPRLPWAKQVPAFRTQTAAALPILDLLYRDESETVRRSVANHLNDISRADPDLAVRTARRWLKKPDENTSRLVRHAMRTLVKQANPGALTLLGFSSADDISIGAPSLASHVVSLGGELVFEGVIVNEGSHAARLVIDYVVHYQKANGTQAPKVFKLSAKTLQPGERLTVQKRHSFKPISTRKHYAGLHSLGLQVNGTRSEIVNFDVVD
ncbi:MAG: DNA alkylation repair protein [Acidimicrobiales bacterium]